MGPGFRRPVLVAVGCGITAESVPAIAIQILMLSAGYSIEYGEELAGGKRNFERTAH